MSHKPFWEHVEELRHVLIRSGCSLFITTLLAFCFHSQLLALALQPLQIHELYFFTPIEGFSAALKVSFWIGVIFSSPIWLTLCVRFTLPALKTREKRLLLPFIFLSLFFMIAGLLFAYWFTLPVVLGFFQKFNTGLGINMWSYGKTLDLILSLLLAHSLLFELYVALLFCVHFRLLTPFMLKKGRRLVIVLILILAAIFTPPDLLSQIFLALPMILFYESAILYAQFRKRAGYIS